MNQNSKRKLSVFILKKKNRKADYYERKAKIQEEISNIYHEHGGVDGYRTIQAYLLRKGISISKTTTHKYMNTELQLFSSVRKKKPNYEKGTAYNVFENKLKQNFTAEQINQKWCTDFTYLFLTDGSKRYNCSINFIWNFLEFVCNILYNNCSIKSLEKRLL